MRTKVEIMAEIQKVNKLKKELITKGVEFIRKLDELREELRKCKE